MARLPGEVRRVLAAMSPSDPDNPEFLARLEKARATTHAEPSRQEGRHKSARQHDRKLEEMVTAQIRMERAERNRALARQIHLMQSDHERETKAIDRQLRVRDTAVERAAQIAAARKPSNEAWRRWITSLGTRPERNVSLDISDPLCIEWLGCHDMLKDPAKLVGHVLEHSPKKLAVLFTEQNSRDAKQFSQSDIDLYWALHDDMREQVDQLFRIRRITNRDSFLQYIELSRKNTTTKLAGRERATLQIDEYICNDELPDTATEHVLPKLRRMRDLGFDWVFLPLHIYLPHAQRIDSGYYHITEEDRQDMGISNDPMFDEFHVYKLD